MWIGLSKLKEERGFDWAKNGMDLGPRNDYQLEIKIKRNI